MSNSIQRTDLLARAPRAAFALIGAAGLVAVASAAGIDPYPNEPGILEPVSSALQGREIRVPNTDQSVDGVEQSNVEGDVVYANAVDTVSLLGHPITQLTSPNDDMHAALHAMATAAAAVDQAGMDAAADELLNVLLGTTEGRIYDGYSMLNFNRWQDARIGPEHFPADAIEDEYKMKLARDTGQTYESPYDGEQRAIWEVDINMLYYDGQIDSDTFLVRFPFGHHPDDALHVNYRIYSLVNEDFSPTLVMLDRREAQNTVSFPFKGFDSVWLAFEPGQVMDVTVRYPTVRQVRGVYTWGWRVHPPRIQFMQPIYEIQNAYTGEIELDPQGESFAFRNREELTLETIGAAAPEMKMYEVAMAVKDGATPADVEQWLTVSSEGPRGTWIEWADLAKVQTQVPPEAWDVLEAEDGLTPGQFGEYQMVTVYMNNEMYGGGPALNEVKKWEQGDTVKAKLINFDNHTHYFRNVDFGARLHDDILNCCGGGLTSFEIMNFKPSYGAPKVAEMQWRAGWGFRPHYNVIQQQNVFARARDRVLLQPWTGGFGDYFFGYQYTDEARGGDFRFNPPPFIVSDIPPDFSLKDTDRQDGLIIGQHTEGYGVAQMCPQDPAGDFCQTDFGPTNPNGALNWPDPSNPDVEKTELRYPPFLRNPDQGGAQAGDIIAPTGAWRPFLWINPYTGSLYIDPENPELGFWVDLTYSHGAPVFAGQALSANIEMPRASGQVFYQFDDLFHDNSIFSPHPLTSGPGDEGFETDTLSVNVARAFGQYLYVRGRLTKFEDTQFARWVQLHDGAAGEYGCTGPILQVALVRSDGVFRIRTVGSGIAPGAPVCVESLLGGFAARVVDSPATEPRADTTSTTRTGTDPGVAR